MKAHTISACTIQRLAKQNWNRSKGVPAAFWFKDLLKTDRKFPLILQVCIMCALKLDKNVSPVIDTVLSFIHRKIYGMKDKKMNAWRHVVKQEIIHVSFLTNNTNKNAREAASSKRF